MSLANNIRGWRLSRQQSVAVIAAKAGIPPDTLEAIESGEQDPSASMVEALASAIGIPAAWLYSDPKHLELLIEDDEDRNAAVSGGLDPVRERVLLGAREDVELYVLLTAILQSGEPKLRLAAEASLRSLAKQAKQPTVPWQSRPPGHFEPPSD
ncbi:MAG: helix-turn-helix transcriptional regulator [Nitrospirae bacterium]|nr:MAG: helix-turn-helix transcriptional regulator [Nitrospirota bacterium]